MASLTPLSKGLIGLAVIGAVASSVWHLGLKDRLAGGESTLPQASVVVPVVPATPAQPPVPDKAVVVTSPLDKAQAAKLSPAENAEAGRKLLDIGNFAQARAHLEQAVQGGDGGAACHLGEMTLKGQGGIPASQEKSASLFQLAQSRNIICFASGR